MALEEAKKIISSILISAKDGCSLKDLESDYRMICGRPMPYAQLGFSSSAALMDAIQNIAYIQRDNYGAIRYHAKADDSTQHIRAMVCRQKSKSSRKPANSRQRRPAADSRPSSYTSSWQPPPMRHYERAPRPPVQMQQYNYYRGPHPQHPLSVPVMSHPRNYYRGPRPQHPISVPVMSRPHINYGGPPLHHSQSVPVMSHPYQPPKVPFNSISNQTRLYQPPPPPTPSSLYVPPTIMVTINDLNRKFAMDGNRQPAGTWPPQEEFSEQHPSPPHNFQQHQKPPQVLSKNDSIKSAGGDVKIFSAGASNISVTFKNSGCAARSAVVSVSSSSVCTKRVNDRIVSSDGDFKNGGIGALCDTVKGLDIRMPAADTALRAEVQEILQKKPNGIRLSGLKAVYKTEMKKEPPADLADRVRSFKDIVDIEETNFGEGETLSVIVYLKKQAAVKDGPVVAECPEKEEVPNPFRVAVIELPFVPPIGASLECRVAHIVSTNEFYVHFDGSVIEEIMDLAAETYKDNNLVTATLDASCQGCYCAVRDDEFHAWSRVHITAIEGEKITVFYVDFGNVGSVLLSEARPLTDGLSKYKAQAVLCSLSNVTSSDRDTASAADLTEKFFQITEAKRLNATIIQSQGNPPYVSVVLCIADGMLDINDYLRRHASQLPDVSPTEFYPQMPRLNTPKDKYWDVVVSFIQTHTTLTIQLLGEDYLDKLEELTMAAVAFYSSGAGRRVQTATAGKVYIVNTEGTYYRARAQAPVSSSKVNCEFIDYGDSAVVDHDQLYELEPQFAELPCQAVKCTLHGLDRVPAADVDRVFNKLCEVVVDTSFVANVAMDACTDIPCVTLYNTSGDDDLNINRDLLNLVRHCCHDEAAEMNTSS